MEAVPAYGSLALKVIQGQNLETAGNRWLLRIDQADLPDRSASLGGVVFPCMVHQDASNCALCLP